MMSKAKKSLETKGNCRTRNAVALLRQNDALQSPSH